MKRIVKIQIYRRANGDVAIRNELWIIPTVGCVVGIANQIRQRFCNKIRLMTLMAYSLSHSYGCSQR